MMYLLFRYKDWEPTKYYYKKQGEKTIIRAFMKEEIEERNKTIDELNNIV